MLRRFEFQIGEDFHKKRLDEFLFNEFRSLSKACLRRSVRDENCEVNGYVANRGIILRKNDFVEIEIDTEQEKGMRAEPMPLDIVFEDQQIIVIDKPCGMLVHPTNYERNGTLLNGLTHYLNQGKNTDRFIRPHLIHRLDRETSGLILIAKSASASKTLCNHFRRKLFTKKYIALVEGLVGEDQGEINAPIERDELAKKWKVIEGGKDSHSKFSVIKRFSERTLLEFEPVTGRTNQLRIHSAFIGHPIVGDKLHSGGDFPRLCLHASKLGFWHPNGGEKLEFESRIDFFE